MRDHVRKMTAAALCALLLTAPVWGSGCTRTADDATIKKNAASQPVAPTIRAKDKYMQVAIDEAVDGISHREGGPFGAVVVKDGEVLGRAHSRVIAEDDPTLHGEIAALREAGQTLGTYDLTGCVLYTTCEPCAMCLSACLIANVEKVYYGAALKDTDHIGFRDLEIDEQLGGRSVPKDYLVVKDHDACMELYATYRKSNPASATPTSDTKTKETKETQE